MNKAENNLSIPIEKIRNFCIIAHIDHGKSTLADRILEITNTLSKREMSEQVLDSLDLEKERGITIKLQTARIEYLFTNQEKKQEKYILNLIDTPGHVDFSYEVSRSIMACEGALLLVDASQGVEAQTIANLYLALEHNLEIIPVINKIDLPSSDIKATQKEIKEIIGIPPEECLLISAKSGQGVLEVLQEIVRRIPHPKGSLDAPARALIFDSYYDSYKGIVGSICMIDGQIKENEKIKLMSCAPKEEFDVLEVGYFKPRQVSVKSLSAGEVGYFSASIKEIYSLVGDTVTSLERPASQALPGYKEAVPMVFCGIYPVNSSDYQELKDALQKLKLNDSSINIELESSSALGFGFRCGFLGLLHMEIAQERIEREYKITVITTTPSVIYKVFTKKGGVLEIDNPCNLPSPELREKIEEPWVKCEITTLKEYTGAIMELCQEKRGIFVNLNHLDSKRSLIIYEIPLAEILIDFFNQLKSKSKGYASLSYEASGYKEGNLVRLDIKLANQIVDAFSCIVHREKSYQVGRKLTEKLKELIPRQLFEVSIQAAIGQKIIASEKISAIRKNVLAKCYGGDITRKKKLLEKQKAGKKKMKNVGNVEVPQEAFLAVLKLSESK